MTKQMNQQPQQQQPASADLVNSYTNAQASSSITTQQPNMQFNRSQATLSFKSSNHVGSKTVIGVFNSRSDAEAAVSDLRAQGFTQEEINIVSKDRSKQAANDQEYDDDITDGALTGGTLGGIGGLLLGAGAMVIPGVGPILAAGPISAALGGALAGGLAGGLIDWGIPSEVSHRYAEKVAQNRILAVIRTNEDKVNSAAQILRQHGAQDVESHDTK